MAITGYIYIYIKYVEKHGEVTCNIQAFMQLDKKVKGKILK